MDVVSMTISAPGPGHSNLTGIVDFFLLRPSWVSPVMSNPSVSLRLGLTFSNSRTHRGILKAKQTKLIHKMWPGRQRLRSH